MASKKQKKQKKQNAKVEKVRELSKEELEQVEGGALLRGSLRIRTQTLTGFSSMPAPN